MSDPNKILILFLKDIILSLETNSIHKKQLIRLNEFRKIYSFLTETININLDMVEENVKFEDDAKEFAKFVTTAWFMYCAMDKIS